MSSPAAPPVSPFVRGTTDSSTVYYLSTGSRRLIPDAQTLSFLLAGQTVRVLSDAGLAALPLGTPLPSRKDGQLITQKFAAPPPQIIVYYMANGQRRRILDLATQTILVAGGSSIVSIELADLTAIPEGAPLPSRADGVLYQGDDKAYAYLMQGGKRLGFPNATTVRDNGHDVKTMASITPGDLGFIPAGAPFPSTSQFVSPPSAQVPLVLLPVRMETVFQNNNSELWLRIYPDDVHVNSFDPALTTDEQTARASYLALTAADGDARRAAFAAIARQFGPARAAWITSDPSAAGQAAVGAIARYLPERWIVMGYQGNAAGQVLAVGPAIPDSLAVDPTAAGAGTSAADATKWITDFPTAIQAGMAFRITLSGVQQRGFTRLVVLGLRSSVSPSDSAARLNELLQAHHYTDGLELLPINTPTNNTEDVSSGLSTTDPDYAKLFAVEQGPLSPSRPTADGDRLARALGVSPTILAHVSGADGGQDEKARAANIVSWPATWGYYLSQIVTAAVPNASVILPAARDHFADHVRARGHFPTVRVGRQPYGILPVCWSAGWQPIEGRALDAPLNSILTQLRALWEKSVPYVARIPNAQDTEASLVGVFGMAPSSTSSIARGVIGPEYTFAYWSFIGKDLPATWWATLAQSTQIDNSALAAALAKTRLASSTYLKEYQPLSDIMAAPEPLDGLPAPAFVAQMAAMGWQALRDLPLPPAPVPMLFLLLRHAVLREYMDTALGLLTAANAAQPSEAIEAEMVNFAGAVLRPTAWDLLQRVVSNNVAVGALLDGSKNDASLPSFVAFWNAFAQLAQFSAADLDAAFREALDLASYRLDSWITSLAHFRLDQTRAANPAGGIVLGGYGCLENVFPQSQAPSMGYVHAPSLNQSTTAAVLRSGYLTHQGGPQRPFEIDLSSARVRLGLHLLDGIREGQPLSALLGYRLERTLHDAVLDSLISKVRGAFPMPNASQLDVVDGLTLARTFHSDAATFWNKMSQQGVAQTNAQAPGLTAAVSTLYDALDSVADLTLAESVHQLANGNMLRAGATLDSIARGDTPPPEIDFVNTPRSGAALTFRLMTIAIGNDAPGWAVTPRAQAEPRLNAWAATLLGDPSRVRIRARFVGADGSSLSNVEIGLNQLALAPIDLLSFPETQGISGEIAERILRVLSAARPTSVPATASIEIVADRDPAWTPQTIGIAEWLGLLQASRRLTTGARAMEPADLVAQDGTPGAVDTAELQARADAAEGQLRAAVAALQKPTATMDSVLMTAAAFGVTGAVPGVDSSVWPGQATAALADLSSRAQALDRLAAGFVRNGAAPETLRDHDVARLQAIFGASFSVLPALASGITAGWPQIWANSVSLQGGDALASIQWMQRASRIRGGVQRLDTALMYAEALAGRPLLQLQVAQLPYATNDRWVALAAPGASPSSRLSLVAFSPTSFTAGSVVAGMMIDEWIEVCPSGDQTTGVSFQYSDPTARAPQAILLAVQPDDFPEWTLAAVEGSVLEALDLAKIRGVDPDVAFDTVPPLQVDANVRAFQALSDTEMFVLGTDGNLWLEQAPFGAVPPTRQQVDANVSAFQALSDTEVLVLGTDGRLWLEHGPFGTVPPVRQQIDAGQPTLPLVVVPPKPTTTTVPDLSDMAPATAQKVLKASGLVGSFLGVLQGPIKMSGQSPLAGQVVDIGSTVTVHWVKGPKNPQ
jgi:PASTA domain